MKTWALKLMSRPAGRIAVAIGLGLLVSAVTAAINLCLPLEVPR